MMFDPEFKIPNDVCEDIICRFLLNLPNEEKCDPIRVCFQVELAHWYFLDYYCSVGCSPQLTRLKNMPYNQFAYIMFQQTPYLRDQFAAIDSHLIAFKEYKMRVPTYGAILMNQDLTKVVLVEGFRGQWGFPKGKVNEIEEPVMCAAREVLEETGYDIKPFVNEHHYIESKAFDRNDRLYLIQGVDTNYKFEPQTHSEIKSIRWFNIDELPEHKKDTNPKVAKTGIPNGNFYCVHSYVRRLRLWIADKLEGKNKIHNFRVWHQHEGDTDIGIHQGNPSIVSNQRTPTRSQQQLMINKPEKILEPFQFPQPFLQSNGRSGYAGWKLLPKAQQESEERQIRQSKQVIDSNSLQELLFGRQFNELQKKVVKQAPVMNMVSKNRRRLFFEETTPAQGQQTVNVIDKTTISMASKNSTPSASAQFLPLQQTQTPNFTASELRLRQSANPSTWDNFPFDKKRMFIKDSLLYHLKLLQPHERYNI